MKPHHKVTARFNDGVEHRFTVLPEENVLGAALKQDVPILHQCRSGTCGTCIAQLVEGSAEMRSDVASSLLKSEQADGLRLSCVTQPGSDCTFQFDYNSVAGEVRPTKCNTFVNAVDWLAPDVVELTLELADGDWFDFRPGQFVQLKVPGTTALRRYSMATSPDKLPLLKLLVRVLPSGAMSDYLRARANIDDVIELVGPFGSFFWRENLKPQHIMIAGGTGLAPMISILEVIRSKSGNKPDMLLSFGCRNEESLFYQEQLKLYELWIPKLEARVCLDEVNNMEGVFHGSPVSSVVVEDIQPGAVAYLCGPPGMINAARKSLESMGIAHENIYAEQFVASE